MIAIHIGKDMAAAQAVSAWAAATGKEKVMVSPAVEGPEPAATQYWIGGRESERGQASAKTLEDAYKAAGAKPVAQATVDKWLAGVSKDAPEADASDASAGESK